MAERVVSIRLSAKVDEYKRGMLEAANATRTVGTEGEKLAQTREAFNMLGTAGLAAGTLLAAGVGIAIARYADFDQAMSQVQAATRASAGDMDLLTEAAIEAGARTVYSATESANAIEELGKAGISTSDILGGALNGSLDLAAAGGLGVAQAAGIAATTLKQFELNGSEASHVADLLAAGAGKAMGDVSDLGAALNQSGLVANQFGLSVEETVGTLSAFASAGMLGSDAGTSFRTMLLRLANPTDEVKTLMKDLGIEAYNAQGEFIGMAGLAGELQGALGGMSDAQRDSTLAMIFGQDAIRGANILMREGADGITEWTEKVDDQGYAAEQAAIRLDNLKGDVEKLMGALDAAFISMGAGADGPLRALVQGLTGLVDGFNDLPAGAQQAVLIVAAVTAGVLLLGGGFLVAIPRIAAFKIALDTLSGSGAGVRSGLGGVASFLGGPWGIALAVATAAVLTFNKAIEDGVPTTAELKNAAITSADALDLLKAAGERGSLETTWMGDYRTALEDLPGLLDHAIAAQDDWGVALDTSINQRGAYDSLKRLGDAFAEMPIEDATEKFRDLAESQNLTSEQTLRLLEEMPAYRDSLYEAAEASGGIKDNQELLAWALGESTGATASQKEGLSELAEQAQTTEQTVEELSDAIRNFGSDTISTEQAAIDFEDSIASLTGVLEEGQGSLDLTTEAGRKTRGAMLDVASSTNDYAGQVLKMGGSTEQVQGILDRGRQKIVDTMVALGWTEQAARDYANQLVATPAAISTAVRLEGVAAAENALNYAARTRYATIRVSTQSDAWAPGVARPVADGGLFQYQQAFADGGFPTGIYAGRAGSIHKFAEPETGWEAYISGKSSQRSRNIGIWQETGRRLGVDMEGGGRGDVTLIVNNPTASDVVDDTRAAAAVVRASGLVD